MAARAIHVHSQDPLFIRFWNHAQLGLSKNIQEHKRNWIERSGDAILWTVEDMPRIVWQKIQEPRFVTIVLTQMALLANSFAFYPSKTWELTKQFFRWLPLPPLWAVRFSCYVMTCALIIGAALRAYGRFSNHELMATVYQPAPVNGSRN